MATTKNAAASCLTEGAPVMQYGGSEQLKYEEAPLPQIGPDRVRAKVRDEGANPADWKIREGHMKRRLFSVSFPLAPARHAVAVLKDKSKRTKESLV